MKRKIYRNIKKTERRYQGAVPEYDFLKNWTLIKKWAIVNYELRSSAELELLLYLYSEKLFTRTDVMNRMNFMSWDAKMMKRLEERDFIYIWRKRWIGEPNVYDLTHKAKRMINSIYKKLLGLEPIPESTRRNKAFLKNAPYSHKTLAIAIKDHNESLKEKRKQYPFLE